MPYITQNQRDMIDDKLKEFLGFMGVMHPGEFVYVLYQMSVWQASFGGVRDIPEGWTEASRVLADLETVKMEFYRRVIAPYEDKKIEENGDVEPYRFNSKPYKNYSNRKVIREGFCDCGTECESKEEKEVRL